MFRAESPDYEDLLQMFGEAKMADNAEKQEQRKKVRTSMFQTYL
jgi:hypothetical protein